MKQDASDDRLQNGLVGLGLLAACWIILRSVHRYYPIQHWLLFHYVGYWMLALYFILGCAVAGFGLLRVTLGRVLPIREMVALSAPLGVLIYFLWAFLVGWAGLYGTWFFLLTPLILLGVGFLPARRTALRLLRHVRAAQPRALERPRAFWVFPVLACAIIGVFWVYFSILSPNNAGYDARWYHLPLAEQYAAKGGIFRFGEGWVMGTYPQLTSLVYLWAFELPGSVFDRVELCAHLEFAFLVWRVVAIPVLVRRLLPRSWRPRPRALLSWLAVFLFPGTLLYDSSLHLGADHMAALFAIPIYLTLLRAWSRVGLRESLIFGMLLSAAMLTKYTAAFIVLPAGLALFCRAGWLVVRDQQQRSRVLFVAVALSVLCVGLTSPHWLKNWVWYGDPLYPQLHATLTARPWVPEASIPYHSDVAVPWHAARSWAGVVDTLKVTATFAFKHHDWPDLHGALPVFGFLFTVMVLILPFLPKNWALAGIFGLGHLGIILWCNISWQDRYLQVLAPWMAAAVATTVVIIWRLSRPVRVAMVCLLLVQVAWGSDIYFFNTHRTVGSPFLATIDLINSGRLGQYRERYQVFRELGDIADVLPPNAVPLVHESQQTFGIRNRRVVDRPGTQGLLYYSRYRTPAELHAEFQRLGITHVVWVEPAGLDNLASDLIFYDFVTRFVTDQRVINGFNVGKLPKILPPAAPFGKKVAYFGCKGSYALGLYPTESLMATRLDPTPVYPKPELPFEGNTRTGDITARADYAIWDGSCVPAAASALASFEAFAQRDKLTLMRRR